MMMMTRLMIKQEMETNCIENAVDPVWTLLNEFQLFFISFFFFWIKIIISPLFSLLNFFSNLLLSLLNFFLDLLLFFCLSFADKLQIRWWRGKERWRLVTMITRKRRKRSHKRWWTMNSPSFFNFLLFLQRERERVSERERVGERESWWERERVQDKFL